MSFSFCEINIWAVLVAAAATFMVGGLWYAALFPKKWIELHGFSEEEVQQMAKNQGRCFVLFFVGDLILAIVMSILIANLGIESATDGAMLGGLLWLGVAATIGAAKNAATGKSAAIFAIDTSHELAALVVMGLILGAWR